MSDYSPTTSERCPDRSCQYGNQPGATYCARCGRKLQRLVAETAPPSTGSRGRQAALSAVVAVAAIGVLVGWGFWWQRGAARQAEFQSAVQGVSAALTLRDWPKAEAQLRDLQTRFPEKSADLARLRSSFCSALVFSASDSLNAADWARVRSTLGLAEKLAADFELPAAELERHRVRLADQLGRILRTRLRDFEKELDESGWARAEVIAREIDAAFEQCGLPRSGAASRIPADLLARVDAARMGDWKKAAALVEARLSEWKLEAATEALKAAREIHPSEPSLRQWESTLRTRSAVLKRLDGDLQRARSNAELDAVSSAVAKAPLPHALAQHYQEAVEAQREAVVWEGLWRAIEAGDKAPDAYAGVGVAALARSMPSFEPQRDRLQTWLQRPMPSSSVTSELQLDRIEFKGGKAIKAEVFKQDALSLEYRELVSEEPLMWSREVATAKMSDVAAVAPLRVPSNRARLARLAQLQNLAHESFREQEAPAGFAHAGRLWSLQPDNWAELVEPMMAGAEERIQIMAQICPHCTGHAQVRCEKCDGKLRTSGTMRCPDRLCAGTGNFPCQSCFGKGEIRCAQCNGDGHVRKKTGTRRDGIMRHPVYSDADCAACTGGTKKCPPCRGKGGPMECKRCRGTGQVPGNVACAACNSTGQQECAFCRGSGRRD